ncbi:MAG: GNAT family N-acetyltransferase [Clostridia bacterium]|nr:GNAT family N-acetyltransferase [Clostridia bacterium]
MQIRPYKETDKNNFRRICIETASASDKPEKEQIFITKLYCDYYIEQEPQNCFALADDNDEAVGYILCSENMKRYIKAMKPYRASIKKLGFFQYLYSWGEIIAHLPASKKCKAHMHIDILPDYQHKGYGTQLINTLKENLSSKGINSVMLVVGADNKNAVKFYKKNGFKPFLNFGKGILMTLDF